MIGCSFCFWCFELLKARKTIIFELFVQWQNGWKGFKHLQRIANPFKGWSDWYTMQKTVWNTFCCRLSHISENVFSEVFVPFYKRGQGFVSSCTFLNAFPVLHATFFLQWTRFSYRGSSWRTVRALDTILNLVDTRAFKQTIHFYGNPVPRRTSCKQDLGQDTRYRNVNRSWKFRYKKIALYWTKISDQIL